MTRNCKAGPDVGGVSELALFVVANNKRTKTIPITALWLGITTDEMYEIFAVANIVGGTIVIPHTRRAAEYWEELTRESH